VVHYSEEVEALANATVARLVPEKTTEEDLANGVANAVLLKVATVKDDEGRIKAALEIPELTTAGVFTVALVITESRKEVSQSHATHFALTMYSSSGAEVAGDTPTLSAHFIMFCRL
jgi:hypothetical protein